jgi:four helix bundle protein
MKEIQNRTFEFAIRIVKLCQYLEQEQGIGKTLGRQILRSGTSVGANVEEAQAGQSKADFISKYAIALKEARETLYWLRLLAATKILPAERLSELEREAEELTRVIGSIIISTKAKS